MKHFPVTLLLIIIFSSITLSSCANDGLVLPPRLDLSPKIFLNESSVGKGIVLQLKVSNQISSFSTSAYGVENNLRRLFTNLITDSFELQDFEVITADDAEDYSQVTELLVLIKVLNNRIESSTLSSNIIANVSIELQAQNKTDKLTRNFNSIRTQEVALKPTIKEVNKLTEVAISQIVRRLVTDKELLEFASKK